MEARNFKARSRGHEKHILAVSCRSVRILLQIKNILPVPGIELKSK